MSHQMSLAYRAIGFAKGFSRDPLTHWPFPTISRQVYGNLAGFPQNFYGSIHRSYHHLAGRSTGATQLSPELKQLAMQLRRTGLALLPAWIDSATIERIRQRVLELAKSGGRNSSEYMTVVENQKLAEGVPEIFDVFNPTVRAFIEECFGGSFLVNATSVRLTRHVPDEVRAKREVYSDRWHNDSGPISGLAMFVLLKDLTPEGGPTAALDIAATKDIIRKGYASRKEGGALVREIEAHPGKVEMIGPAGTVMFANVARCLHRAGIPAPGMQREWMQFRLFPCSGPTDTSRLQPAKILKYTNGINQDY